MAINNMEKIIIQYALATGKNKVIINSRDFILEFGAWLKNYQKIAEEYTKFLNECGFKFGNSFCAEVGKNSYDSVVIPYQTKIITPDSSEFKNMDSDRIIEGNIIINDMTPILIRKDKENVEIPRLVIDTYMTQNPYTSKDIKGWEKLHNSGEFNIMIGAFGNIQDKDKEDKIAELKNFEDKLTTDDYKIEYETDGDKYFYVVGSKRKILTRF